MHITDPPSRKWATILAALHYYKYYRLQGNSFDPKQDHLIDAIAARSGEALDLAEVEALCADLDNAMSESTLPSPAAAFRAAPVPARSERHSA